MIADAAALRDALARLVRYENGPSHSHGRCGRWDASNRNATAGRPCTRCHDFADARALLGLPRWTTVPQPERSEEATTCDDECGCGGVA